MKHVQSFHGSVTALLTRLGYDSAAVLAACNAWRGSIKSGTEEAKSEVKLAGRINAKGDDKRTLSATDKVTVKAKGIGFNAAGGLLALSDELRRVTEKHGATIVLTEFSEEIADWLDRETFRLVQGPAEKPAEKSETVNA